MKFFSIAFFIILFLLSGCGEKMPIPSVMNSPESFGANDTSYIHLEPDWTAASMGYFPRNPMKPVDITIGDDGYLFIADQNNNRIITVTQSGNLATHQRLDQIYPIPDPIAIDINEKLNLVIVNGTNTIYIWNQYINQTGLNAVAFDTTENGELDYSYDTRLIDSVRSVCPFYVDRNENSSFQGVAFGPAEDNAIYVTDNANNRILRIGIYISGVADLGRYPFPLYSGFYSGNVAEFGSGAGTVDNPRGITCDDAGNIYFTQLGGNFLVQKLKKVGNNFSAAYTLYEDPIMDLNRFMGPYDLALGGDDAIFVLDADDDGKVSKFFNKGAKAGRQANLGKKGLVDARFDNPTGIAVSDDEVVYITNTDKSSIERYQHSVSEGDVPQEPL